VAHRPGLRGRVRRALVLVVVRLDVGIRDLDVFRDACGELVVEQVQADDGPVCVGRRPELRLQCNGVLGFVPAATAFDDNTDLLVDLGVGDGQVQQLRLALELGDPDQVLRLGLLERLVFGSSRLREGLMFGAHPGLVLDETSVEIGTRDLGPVDNGDGVGRDGAPTPTAGREQNSDRE